METILVLLSSGNLKVHSKVVFLKQGLAALCLLQLSHAYYKNPAKSKVTPFLSHQKLTLP